MCPAPLCYDVEPAKCKWPRIRVIWVTILVGSGTTRMLRHYHGWRNILDNENSMWWETAVLKMVNQMYWGLRPECMYCTETNSEIERVGLDLVTAARTSEEGLKNVHLKPEAENDQKGYKGDRATYTAIPMIPRHSMIEYQKMRLLKKSVQLKERQAKCGLECGADC